MSLEKVATTGEIAAGHMIGVKIDDIGVLVANVGGKYYAISSNCTHKNCNLSKGSLSGEIVTCPCHGSQFNVTNGEVVRGPAQKAESVFNVVLEGDLIMVEK